MTLCCHRGMSRCAVCHCPTQAVQGSSEPPGGRGVDRDCVDVWLKDSHNLSVLLRCVDVWLKDSHNVSVLLRCVDVWLKDSHNLSVLLRCVDVWLKDSHNLSVLT